MPDENNDEDISEQRSTGNTSGFLGDLTDGRPKGNWKSRFEIDALKHIRWEQKYLLILLLICLLLPLIIGILSNEYLANAPTKYQNLKKYLFALFGGTLGGTLFAMKWLVHSVAKDTWNYDRQLWRVFTPLLSGGLAFVIIILVNCQMFDVTKPENLSIHKCYGIGFLVGYFSDNAIGKLTEIAQVLFGSSLSKGK
jgi:hypothetical protein